MTSEAPIIFSIDKYQMSQKDIGEYPVFIEVKKEKLKRVAEIKSKILLKNNTNLPLKYFLLSNQGSSEPSEFTSQQSGVPIAFDQIDKVLLFSMKSGMSEKIHLANTVNSKDATIKLSMVCSKESLNNLVLDLKNHGPIIHLEAKPALKIVNYCPVALEYTLKSRKYEDSNIIFRNKPLEIFRFDPYSDSCDLTLISHDIYSTVIDLKGFLNKKHGCSSKIKLVSANDPDMKIYLDMVNDRQNNTLVIYSKLNIYNETGFKFDMASFYHGNQKYRRSLVESGNRAIVFMASKAHDSLLLKVNNQTFENWPSIKPIGNMNDSCVFPKKISYTLNQTIKGRSEKGSYELNMIVAPNVVEVAKGILTKTLTVLPKYVFVNNTDHNLCIIQQQSNHIAKLAPKSRLAVVWCGDFKACSFQVDDTTRHL
jgi:hypothetical protein